MFARGPYGIEYNPKPLPEDNSGGWLWLVVLVVVVAVISLIWTLIARVMAPEDPQVVELNRMILQDVPTPSPKPSDPKKPVVQAETSQSEVATSSVLARRPVKVRALLLRLEEALATKNVEMSIATIEQLRALPGSPAADLDDALARRLGRLNVRWLFELKNAQWVRTVEVRRGESATRIANNFGSTYASMVRLNRGVNLSKIRTGQKVVVMNHPRFSLIVHRRTHLADLQLNGKFFQRYELDKAPMMENGTYEWREVTLALKKQDRDELDELLPANVSVIISEY